ncbi:MAG: wax ester/triacylglycerol synthase family O-acyltransferase [Pseudomonadota bacterium]
MDQLSGIDATFLYLETPKAPMHIGGVLFCAPANPGDRGLDFQSFRALVESRLHVSPVFRRRVVHVPLDLDNPFWVEDPHFNLDAHVSYMALPGKRSWTEMRHLLEHLFSVPLDTRRPLWSLTFVEGLDGIQGLPPGSFAVVHKIHHAAADGMSGRDLLTCLLDPTPEVREFPGHARWMPDMQPSLAQLLTSTGLGLLKRPFGVARTVGSVLGGVLNLGRDLLLEGSKERDVNLTGPRTRLNVPVEPQRVFGAVRLQLASLRAARGLVSGASLNDVVLTVCAGALRRYLQANAELPAQSLTALVPISVRRSVLEANNNRLSAMIVSLATLEADPVARLEAVHGSVRLNKDYAEAIGARTLSDVAQVVPFTLGIAASRFYSRMQMALYHPPLFNLVITNVPGPRRPLYFNGARVLSTLGTAPIIDGLGMIIVVTSYLEELSISVTACPSVLPDVEFFEQCLRESMEEIDAAVEERASAARPAAPTPLRAVPGGSQGA